jgi:hypothetical protein
MNTTHGMGYGAAHLASLLTRDGVGEVELVHDTTAGTWSVYTKPGGLLAQVSNVATQMLEAGWLEKSTPQSKSSTQQRYQLSEAGAAAYAARTGTEVSK